jgi:hypothetical protein
MIVVLAACEPALRPPALPPLAASLAPQPIVVDALELVDGETMRWDIASSGLTIAQARLDVAGSSATLALETSGLASSFAAVRYALTSQHDGARPIAASEQTSLDGKVSAMSARFESARVVLAQRTLAVPQGAFAHTVASTLGAIRAWTRDAGIHRPGFLYLVHDGEIYRLDLAAPRVAELFGASAIRVDGRIAMPDGDNVALTLWLRDRDRAPLRIEVRSAAGALVATLL